MSGLDVETVLRLGGWDARYARVLAIAARGEIAIALVGSNGDLADVDLDELDREADGSWTPGSSGCVNHEGAAWSDSRVSTWGQAQPGSAVHVRYAGVTETVTTSANGWWAFVAPAGPDPDLPGAMPERLPSTSTRKETAMRVSGQSAVRQLPAGRAHQLSSMAFSYPEVGATAGVLPPDYATIARSVQLPPTARWDNVIADLMSWRVQERAGLRVAASAELVAPGVVVILRIGFGRLAVDAPCRVGYVVEEDNRRGFAYGTLPGHPESGEEAFMLTRHTDGGIEFAITAFSRPASILAKAGGPLTTVFQRIMTGRYLRALDTP